MSAIPRPASSPVRQQNIPLGIGLMVLAIFLYSANDTLGKFLAATYLPPQILLLRSVAAMLVLAPAIRRVGIGALFRVERPWLQLARALLATLEVTLFYWSVKYLPLADAMTYYLAGPIYVTLMAAVFLREHVGWRRWTAVLVGFGGVLVALGPSAESFGWPVLIAFSGSVVYAVFLILTRSLRGTPDTVMAAWQVAFAFVFGAVASPVAWVPFGAWYEAVLLAALGIGSVIAAVAVNRSLAVAPVSVVVPYQYLLIVWAVIFGYIFFRDVPSIQMLAGAAIIIASGLYIFVREQRAGVPSALEAPPER